MKNERERVAYRLVLYRRDSTRGTPLGKLPLTLSLNPFSCAPLDDELLVTFLGLRLTDDVDADSSWLAARAAGAGDTPTVPFILFWAFFFS
jgi:hypothetical protein